MAKGGRGRGRGRANGAASEAHIDPTVVVDDAEHSHEEESETEFVEENGAEVQPQDEESSAPVAAPSSPPNAAPSAEVQLSEEEVQRRVNEELEKRVQAALEKRLAEDAARRAEEAAKAKAAEEAAQKAKEEEAARIAQEEAAEAERQAALAKEKEAQLSAEEQAAAKAAAVQAEIDRRVKAELEKRLSTKASAVTAMSSVVGKMVSAGASAVQASKTPAESPEPEEVVENASMALHEDEEAESKSLDGTVVRTPTANDYTVVCDAGLLAVGPSSSEETTAAAPPAGADNTVVLPHLSYEKVLAEESEKRHSKLFNVSLNPAVAVACYNSKREEGRCLEPTLQEEPQRPTLCHQEIMLGHFTSPQTLATAVNALPAKLPPQDREPKSDDKTAIGDATLIFEKDTLSLPADEIPEGSLSVHVTPDEMEKDSEAASEKLLDRVTCPDVLQLWERTRGNPVPMSVGGGTAGKVYTYDYEPKKAAQLMSMFNAGSLLEVSLKRVAPSLHSMHGADVDPLFGSMAVYNINAQTRTKLTETFYFDIATDSFFPTRQKFPSNRHQNFATFIPTDQISAPLYLVIRMYRLASADHTEFVDMYTRTTRYKQPQVIAHKQKMQLLANHSDVTQELGWYALPLTAQGKLVNGDQVIEKLHLSGKNLSDQTVFEYVLTEQKRAKLATCLCNIVINVSDASRDEVSFPHHGSTTSSIEEESEICLQNLDVLRAPKRTMRYCPYRAASLNSGFYNAYTNVMYVRLFGLNLAKTSQRWPAGQTTLAVQIALKDNDDNLSEIGLPAIYCRSLGGSIVDVCGWSNVSVGHKEVEFHDEFKIQLPLTLTERHHVFFTFWAMPLSDRDKPLKIGHAVLPIFSGGTLLVKEVNQLTMINMDGANQCQTGYLVRSSQLGPQHYQCAGSHCFSVGTACRSSIYSSSPITSSFFTRMPNALREVVRDQSIFAISGAATHLNSHLDQAHLSLIGQFNEIPFAEQLASYPMFAGFLLSFVASKSTSVGLAPRCSAFKAFIEISLKIHQWESSAVKKPKTSANGKPMIVRTTPMTWLYHFMTNRLLNTSEEFPVYAAVVEILLMELRRNENSKLLLHVADIIWFVYDLILRSLYLFAVPAITPPSIIRPTTISAHQQQRKAHVIDDSFYPLLKEFVILILTKLGPQGGMLMSRTAVFLRHLFRCCNRGAILEIVEEALKLVKADGLSTQNMSLVRIMLEADQAVLLSLPSMELRKPQYLLRICLSAVLPQLMSKSRDARSSSSNFLYNFLVNAVHNPTLSGGDVSVLGVSCFEVVEFLALNWGNIRNQGDKDSTVALNDRRQLMAIALWSLQKQRPEKFKAWLRECLKAPKERNPAAGLLQLLGDALVAFRFTTGANKKDPRMLKPSEKGVVKYPSTSDMALDDARFSTVVCLIVSRIATFALQELQPFLYSLKEERTHPVLNHFLWILDNLCDLSNSYTALEAAALLLFQTHVQLFPEFVSRRARNSGGMVLLAIRLMSCGSKTVQGLASRVYLDTARRHLEFLGSLAKLKHLTASALVHVSETPGRNVNRAGDYISANLKALVEVEADTPFDHSNKEYLARYIGIDADALARSASQAGVVASGDFKAGKDSRIVMTTAVLTTANVSYEAEALEQSRRAHSATGTDLEKANFPPLFREMGNNMITLLADVIRMQADDTMKLQEVKTSAYRQICSTFLNQNSIAEALKWFYRLAELHSQRRDYVEAALTKVYIAAIGFRVSELFYAINGKDASGCRLPPAYFTNVFWHHFLRLLPQLESELSVEVMYPMVRDMAATPEDKCFTVQGQSQLFHEAAVAFGKANHYELAVSAIKVVDCIAEALDDFETMTQIHEALKTWSTAMAEGKKTGGWKRRVAAKYFYVKATGGGIEPFERVYRMSSITTLLHFQNFAKNLLSGLVGDLEHVLIDDGGTNLVDGKGRVVKGTPKQIAAFRQGRVVARMYDLNPIVEPEYSTAQAPMSFLHKTCYFKRFQAASRINAETREVIPEVPTATVPGRPGVAATANLDVKKHRMTITEHLVDVGFPSIVSCHPVQKTMTKELTAAETALQTVEDLYDTLFHSASGEKSMVALRETMTPLGFFPHGSYYKAVLQEMGAYNQGIVNAVSDYIKLAKSRLAATEGFIMKKDPELYAQLLKGTVDMECTLEIVLDCIESVEAVTQ